VALPLAIGAKIGAPQRPALVADPPTLIEVRQDSPWLMA
jgi:hypothetical protein